MFSVKGKHFIPDDPQDEDMGDDEAEETSEDANTQSRYVRLRIQDSGSSMMTRSTASVSPEVPWPLDNAVGLEEEGSDVVEYVDDKRKDSP